MRNIVLCGFMGSGKTSVGKLLAEKYNMTFVDTDELIVKKTGMEISKIFSEYGEPYFRQLETETIKELIGSRDTLISLGGGLAANEVNHPYLKKAGCVILLDCGIEETLRRITGDKTRPLTKGGVDDIIKRYNFRKPIYESVSDIVIDSSKTAEETCQNIVKVLEELK